MPKLYEYLGIVVFFMQMNMNRFTFMPGKGNMKVKPKSF